MRHLPERKAPVHDNIRNIDLRNLPVNAVTHSTKIINAAFRFHYFPKTRKQANVISTPKPQEESRLSKEQAYNQLIRQHGQINGKNTL
jgi:hypothetical protein